MIFIGIWACPPLRVGRAFRSSLPLGLLTTVVSACPSLRSGPLNHRRCGGLLRNCSMPSRALPAVASSSSQAGLVAAAHEFLRVFRQIQELLVLLSEKKVSKNCDSPKIPTKIQLNSIFVGKKLSNLFDFKCLDQFNLVFFPTKLKYLLQFVGNLYLELQKQHDFFRQKSTCPMFLSEKWVLIKFLETGFQSFLS